MFWKTLRFFRLDDVCVKTQYAFPFSKMKDVFCYRKKCVVLIKKVLADLHDVLTMTTVKYLCILKDMNRYNYPSLQGGWVR